MIERFKGHARRQRPVADDRDHGAILASASGRHGDPQSRADRSARMPHSKSVVFALAARRKWRETPVLLDGVQASAPARQHLVRIGLVAHIPNKTVEGRIEYIV